MNSTFIINPKDNVAVILGDDQSIPRGHKISLRDIKKGEYIVKYGSPIGIATEDIPEGSHVHIHNTKTNLDTSADAMTATAPMEDLDSSTSNQISGTAIKVSDFSGATSGSAPALSATFQGYRRKSGKVGVRNEIWIIPTVGCIIDVANLIQQEARKQFLNANSIDGIYSFSHPYGCSQLGADGENTAKILAAISSHPNAGGVLLLGLGCENTGIDEVLKYVNKEDMYKIKTLICQDVQDEISAAIEIISKLTELASQSTREECPLSQLVVGVKCGGSDGLSGITANPMVGRFSDQLIQMGGSVLISEIPEMFGAEHIMLSRCESEEVREKMFTLFNSFKKYYTDNGLPIYENPSPGNKEGGITTLEDKSLGCTQKAGTSPVVDVLEYGTLASKKGLSVLWSPGNDLVSTTALAASGAQVILFTTGRGTPYGGPVPTVKISSNSSLFERKPDWIDFDAGKVLSVQDASLSEASSSDAQEALANAEALKELDLELFQKVLSVANGNLTASEKKGYKNMTIFKSGVTL